LYQIDPPSIDFGNIPEGQRKSMTLLVTPQRSLSGLTVRSSSDQFTAVLETEDSKQSKYKVRVSSQETSSIGQASSDVILQGVDDSGKSIPSVAVHVRGLCQADIQINPPSLLFGLRHVGIKTEGTVIIRSLKGENLTLVRAECDSPSVEVKPVGGVSGSKEISLRVIQDVRLPGINLGTITVTLETEKKKLVKRVLDVSCEGVR
jgi:hypothetical protein